MKLLSAEIPKFTNMFSEKNNNTYFNITMYNGFDYSGNNTTLEYLTN